METPAQRLARLKEQKIKWMQIWEDRKKQLQDVPDSREWMEQRQAMDLMLNEVFDQCIKEAEKVCGLDA